jgi:uncharacterized protein (TIGR02453 family)
MKSILSFLKELAKNNNREWFTENKKTYQEALDQFKIFAGEILNGIISFDPTLDGQDVNGAIFRIYKDVRFSKDKTPYKTHFGCWMTKGGRKSTDAGYYFHLEPGGSFLAAGVWMPPKEQLNLIRQEIVFNPTAFLSVIEDPALREGFERGGKEDMLKKGPIGFPKDFEFIDEIKYKHYIFSKNFTDKELLQDNFSEQVISGYHRLLPLVNYLNQAMSFTGNE